MRWQRTSFFETAHHTTSTMDTRNTTKMARSILGTLSGCKDCNFKHQDEMIGSIQNWNLHETQMSQMSEEIHYKFIIWGVPTEKMNWSPRCITAVFRSCQRSATCLMDSWLLHTMHTPPFYDHQVQSQLFPFSSSIILLCISLICSSALFCICLICSSAFCACLSTLVKLSVSTWMVFS